MIEKKILQLPKPIHKSKESLEELMKKRKTFRTFSKKELDLPVLSQLLWSLQGITFIEKEVDKEPIYHRAAPSAGRSYPITIYTVSSAGFQEFNPIKHELILLVEKDLRKNLAEAPFTMSNKEAIENAPLVIVLTINNNQVAKITPLLERAVQYAFLEVGHAVQNLLLQATALNLGVCTMTSFDLTRVYDVLQIPREYRPVYLLPIGFGEIK